MLCVGRDAAKDHLKFHRHHADRVPFPTISLWDGDFVYFRADDRAWPEMQRLGYVKQGNDTVLLFHDYDNDKCEPVDYYYDSTHRHTKNIMGQLLRMHTLMTPQTTVLLVDWSAMLSIGCHTHYYLSSHYASRVSMGRFLQHVNQRIHCVGVGMGSHACAAVCRELKAMNRSCARIVGLDPPHKSYDVYRFPHIAVNAKFGRWPVYEHNLNGHELSSKDADYVVIISSNEGLHGPRRPFGHEYIRSDLGTTFHEGCLGAGGWWGNICSKSFFGNVHCEYVYLPWWNPAGATHKSRDLCSHHMAVVTFMKSLDTASGILTIYESPKFFLTSTWNAYSVSRDYSLTIPYFKYVPFSSVMKLDYYDMHSKMVLLVVTHGGKETYFDRDYPSFTRTYGGHFYRWYVGDFDVKADYLKIYARPGTNIVLVRGYVPRSTYDYQVPMTSSWVIESNCYVTHTYWYSGDRLYNCWYSKRKDFNLFSWRTQMNVTGKQAVGHIPPLNCLHYQGVNYNRYVIYDSQVMFSGYVNEWVDVSGIVESRKDVDFFALSIVNGKGYQKVLGTFWDRCNLILLVGYNASFDRYDHKIRIQIPEAGIHVLKFHFESFVVMAKVHVHPSQEMFPTTPAITTPDEDSEYDSWFSEMNETAVELSSGDFDDLYNSFNTSKGVDEDAYFERWCNMTGSSCEPRKRSRRSVGQHSQGTVTIYSSHRFTSFPITTGVYATLKYRGRFNDLMERNIIILVHGWHALHSSDGLFRQLLRFHQKITPEAVIMYVNWEDHGANRFYLWDAADAAVKLNISNLLEGINPHKSKVHCIGHSLGAHACGAVCRQYRSIHNVNCTRIVGLDPAGPWFKSDSPSVPIRSARLSYTDADYVAAFLTNRQFSALRERIGHEYLTTNIYGEVSEACYILGKFRDRVCATGFAGNVWCEDIDLGTMAHSGLIPHTQDSCSHLMALVHFMKTLDIYDPVSVFKLSTSTPSDVNKFMHSAWSGYVVGKDYTYDTYTVPYIPVWYSFAVDGYDLKHYDMIIIISLGDIEISRGYKRFSVKNGDFFVNTVLSMNLYDNRKDFYIAAQGPLFLVHVRKTQSYIGNQSEFKKDRFSPMTAFADRVYSCTGNKVNHFTHRCVPTSESKWVPIYRPHMNITNRFLQVPPVRGCLPFNHEMSDTITMKLQPMEVLSDRWVRVQLNFTHDDELLKLSLKDKKSDITYVLFTFWDKCSGDSPVEVEVDRRNYSVRVLFKKTGYFDLVFGFQFHVDTMALRVIQSPSTTTKVTTTTTTTTTTMSTLLPTDVTASQSTTIANFATTFTSESAVTEAVSTVITTTTVPTSFAQASSEERITTLIASSASGSTFGTTYTVAVPHEDSLFQRLVEENQKNDTDTGGLSGGVVAAIMIVSVIIVGGIMFAVMRTRTNRIIVLPGETTELISV